MNIPYLLCLLSIALVTGCTDLSGTAAVAAVPTPTPENYALYTDQDLQIYADSIDVRIQQALKNGNANEAQELGRKRQELIAEFNRRNLKRSTTQPLKRTTTQPLKRITTQPPNHPRMQKPPSPQPSPLKQSGNGLPGED